MGQYERDIVKPFIAAKTQQNQIKAVSMAAAAGGIGFAAYTFYKWGKYSLDWASGILDDAKDWKSDLFLLGDKESENNNVDATDLDSYGYPFQVLFGGGGQAENGNDVNILGLPGWGIIPGVL
jgi:hypothetical protein